MKSEQFLRSINLCYDATAPDRITHYHPTSKSIPLLRALLGEEQDRAFFIIAPYGSGKSLSATYLLHAIENRSDSVPMLKRIASRLKTVSPEFAGQMSRRFRKNKYPKRGLAIALHGYAENMPKAIHSAIIESMKRMNLGRELRAIEKLECSTGEQLVTVLEKLTEKLKAQSFDHVTILWDEFGRHLESLVSTGQTSSLIDIQTLAEYSCRSKDLVMTLGLFLHQGLLQYSGNMPNSARADWKKIEGRFKTFQYIDDSKEIYRLIGEVIESGQTGSLPTNELLQALVTQFQEWGLFTEFTSGELQDLFAATYPLEPFTLFLLPRISARLAQNERTLFDFIHSVDHTRPVTPVDLFEFFSSAMRADTSIGGTHRHWVETQSALTKVADDENFCCVLRTAALLSLGVGGERQRASREQLVGALTGYRPDQPWDAYVNELIEKKLLLHRKHTDEVTIWHGTDIDLRSKLVEATARLESSFDHVEFLATEFPPRVWNPVRYNTEFCIRRYFEGTYITVEQLESKILEFNSELTSLPIDCDGMIFYVLSDDRASLDKAKLLITDQSLNPQILFVVPDQPLGINAAGLEAYCLSQMQLDRELVESDPLALAEIQQLTDDAFSYLAKLIDQLFDPAMRSATWYHQGQEFRTSSSRELREELSRIAEQVFSQTPKLNNEMIIRKKPSAVVVNARKKLMFAVLDRYGKEELEIEGNFPDKSIFRTVLLNTGLYRCNDGDQWAFAPPTAIDDPGLKVVWEIFREFLTTPRAEPKEFQPLFDRLLVPPIGLRRGVLPILLACALRAFPSAISLSRKSEYVEDILPTVVEEICKTPDIYRLTVLDLDDDHVKYLRSFYECFGSADSTHVEENDLVRLCFDALAGWRHHLPSAAMTTSKWLSKKGIEFRRAIRRQQDPVKLLLVDFPALFDGSIKERGTLIKQIKECKSEIDGVVGGLAGQAKAILLEVLNFSQQQGDEDLRGIVQRWCALFSERFQERLKEKHHLASTMFLRMQMPYESDLKLLNSLAMLFTRKSLNAWDDQSPNEFEKQAELAVRKVEQEAMIAKEELDEQTRKGMADLLNARIQTLKGQLAELEQRDEVRPQTESMVDDIRKVT